MKVDQREPSFRLYKTFNNFSIQHLFVFNKTLRLFYLRTGNRRTSRIYHGTRSNEQHVFIKPKVKQKVFQTIKQLLRTALL